MRGKAKHDPHRKAKEEFEDDVPRICMGYCFMEQNDEEEQVPILVIIDKKTKVKFSHDAPRKGIGHEWVIDRVIKDIDSLGYGQVISKCDQEPALVELQDGIIEKRRSETIPRKSEMGESASNGDVERAIQSVEGAI